MTANFEALKSLPEMQLCMEGDDRSFGILVTALASLSDKDFSALEEDLDIYARTSLVGVQMSKLLAQLRIEASEDAAADKVRALPVAEEPKAISAAA